MEQENALALAACTMLQLILSSVLGGFVNWETNKTGLRGDGRVPFPRFADVISSSWDEMLSFSKSLRSSTCCCAMADVR